MKLTHEQRAELKALAEAIEPGQWGVSFAVRYLRDHTKFDSALIESILKAGIAAREAIPALLADLEEAESEAEFARNDRDYWKGLAKSRDELSEGLTNRIEQLDAELAAIEAARREERVEMRQIVEALEPAGEMGDGEFRYCCMTRYGKPHADWCVIGIALNAYQNKGRTK